MDEARLKGSLRTVHYYKRRREDAERLEAVSFTDSWITDPHARTLEEVVFDPSRPPGPFQSTTMTNTASWSWNNWPGILAATLPPLPPLPCAGVDAGVRRLRAHLTEVLFAGNAAHSEWCLDYLAVLVKRPWCKTGIIPLFTGPQGAGKNTVFDFFRTRILGEAISGQLQNPREGIFDRFGTAHRHRIFLQIDEADRLAMCESELKNLVTADTMASQQKFRDRETLPNYINLLMTTNSACPVRVSETERRFAIFCVSSARVGDHAYFDALHAALNTEGVARAFYELLLGRDISRFGQSNLQASRPITAYFDACRALSISPFKRFLSAAINERLFFIVNVVTGEEAVVAEVQAARLYAHYVSYFASTTRAGGGQGGGRLLSQAFFFNQLKNIEEHNGVRFTKRAVGNFYRFDYALLRAFLERTREYDAEAATGRRLYDHDHDHDDDHHP